MSTLLAKARAFAKTKAGQQVGRFVRLTATAGFTAWLTTGHDLTWTAGGAAVVAGAEVAYRAIFPAE